MYHHQPGPGTLDLAVALGILAVSDQIDAQSLDKSEFLGEPALTGELRGVNGVLPAAIAAARNGRAPTSHSTAQHSTAQHSTAQQKL